MNVFRVLPWRAALPLLVILVTVSAASAVTGLMVSEAPATIASIVGTGGNVIAVYGNVSRIPETSTVPASALPKLENLPGVLVASPEVLSPALANGQAVFVRGVSLPSFVALDHPALITGSWPLANGSAVLVGSRLAANLRVEAGDSLSLASFFGGSPQQVLVSGIFQTGTSRDDEIVTSLALAQQIRGIGKDTVTLYRVEIDPSRFNSSALVTVLGGNQTSRTAPNSQAAQILPTSVLLSAGSYLAGNPAQAIDTILSRNLGLSQSSLWSLVVVVVLCSSLAVYYGAAWTVDAYSPLLNLLSSIGLSGGKKVGYPLLIVGLGSLAACFIGSVVGYLGLLYVSGVLSIQVLFHSFVPTFSFPVTAASVLLPTAVSLVALTYCSRGIGPRAGAEYARAQ